MDWTWDLSVLYRGFDDEQITRDFDALKTLVEDAKGMLQGDEKAALENITDAFEKISCLSGKLFNFASLSLSTDAGNESAQMLMDQLMRFSVQISLLNSAYVRYLGKIENLQALIDESDALQKVSFALLRDKKAASHLMDEGTEEWILKMSLTGSDAFSTLRDKLDATLTVDVNGESIPLSAARALAYDPDAATRKAAYEAELKAYTKIDIPMAACLNSIKGEAQTLAEAEHFSSILEKTLFNSNMDRETLDAMLSAIREALPAFRKYLRKKGELLGHKDGLPFYDLFAPITPPGFTPKTFSIEEAREKLVLEMSKFSPEMGEFIKNAFDSRWIDVFPREGKSGGAFCAGVHHMDISRILTNFAGSFSDVSTLAHELGHAWHNRCMQGLPSAMTDAPMPLAETASIFNETLLANAVMENASKEERLSLLEGSLMEATQTIMDIFSRYLFEYEVIERRKDHTMPVSELKEIMLWAQGETYGDGLDETYRHPYMWACKSHYYSAGFNFYNFPYAFGQLFGTGVYAIYKQEGPAFVPRYNQLLRSCGSMNVADVAMSVGIDVRSIDFWRTSLKVYIGMIDEFVSLADQLF
ncbi:MAG: M3 family oligoendopeptidase [Clostridia bacterium]|nr:M3 family oligoendopeptidase [Clostridia bacterium]